MTTDPDRADPTPLQRQVLIVGAGPAGLAAALMLAKRGWSDIVVLESRASANHHEPDRSYSYLIDGRGQRFTDMMGLTGALSKAGVPTSEFVMTVIEPDGRRQTRAVPFFNPTRTCGYWIPRRRFLEMLCLEIQDNWQRNITIRFGSRCTRIDAATNGLEVVAESGQEGSITFRPALLLGCDGLQSLVRETLRNWNTGGQRRFATKSFRSPSSGLKYKVLSLPPRFPVDREATEPSRPDIAYVFRGASAGRSRAVSLGLFPVRSPDEPRTANVITSRDHEVWRLNDAEAVHDFFAHAFPQLAIRSIVDRAEAARFAASAGGVFPAPQYSRGLSWLPRTPAPGEPPEQASAIGVLLLGDAIHCFPPDIGQGVNAALEDVCILDAVLSESRDDLAVALPAYERTRLPDAQAVARLARIAAPWQYNQAGLGKKVWGMDFALRLALARAVPSLFSPPAYILVKNPDLSYRDSWALTRRTTRNLWMAAVIVGLSLAGLAGALIAMTGALRGGGIAGPP